MATAHIRLTVSSIHICQHEEVKNIITLKAGSPLPSGLTLAGVGAPIICPECAAGYVCVGKRTHNEKALALVQLLQTVASETHGTPQGRETVARYTDAMTEQLSPGQRICTEHTDCAAADRIAQELSGNPGAVAVHSYSKRITEADVRGWM